MASASHASLSAAEIVTSRIPLGATKEKYQKWILQKHHCLPNDNDFHRFIQSGMIDELRLHSSDEDDEGEDELPTKKFKPNTLPQRDTSTQTESHSTGLKLFE